MMYGIISFVWYVGTISGVLVKNETDFTVCLQNKVNDNYSFFLFTNKRRSCMFFNAQPSCTKNRCYHSVLVKKKKYI